MPDGKFSVCFFIAGLKNVSCKCVHHLRLATCNISQLTRSADNKDFPHHLNCQLNPLCSKFLRWMKVLASSTRRKEKTKYCTISDYPAVTRQAFLPSDVDIQRLFTLSDQGWRILSLACSPRASEYRNTSAAPFDPGRTTGLRL